MRATNDRNTAGSADGGKHRAQLSARRSSTDFRSTRVISPNVATLAPGVDRHVRHRFHRRDLLGRRPADKPEPDHARRTELRLRQRTRGGGSQHARHHEHVRRESRPVHGRTGRFHDARRHEQRAGCRRRTRCAIPSSSSSTSRRRRSARSISRTRINFGAGGPDRGGRGVHLRRGLASRAARTRCRRCSPPIAQTLARLGASQDSVARFLDRLADDRRRAHAARHSRRPSRRPGLGARALRLVARRSAHAHRCAATGAAARRTPRASRPSACRAPAATCARWAAASWCRSPRTSGASSTRRASTSRPIGRTPSRICIAPDGRVTVASALADGTQSLTNLQFGGNPSLPQESRTAGCSRPPTSCVGERERRAPLQARRTAERGSLDHRHDPESLRHLLLQLARRLRRESAVAVHAHDLRHAIASPAATTLALYLGDAWRQSAAFQIDVRHCASRARASRATPAYNPDIETLFGRRTDRSPSEVHLSPRVGFTYFTGAARRARRPAAQRRSGRRRPGRWRGAGGPGGFNAASWIIRGGVGEFRGKISSNLVATAVEATGLAGWPVAAHLHRRRRAHARLGCVPR